MTRRCLCWKGDATVAVAAMESTVVVVEPVVTAVAASVDSARTYAVGGWGLGSRV
jgi:hypothetical protein